LVLQDPTQWCHAFLNHWIGFPLRRFLRINLTPHSETPSPFYKTALNDFKIHLDDSNYDCNNKFVFKTAYLWQLSNKKVSINVVSKYPAIKFANIWKSLYKLPLTLESRQVWWLILHRVIPVRERLAKLRIISGSNCLFCSNQEESLVHPFLQCEALRQLRALVEAFVDLNNCHLKSEILFELCLDGNAISPYLSIIFLKYLYVVWSYRKDVAFKRKKFVLQSLLSLFKCRLRNRIKLDYSRLDNETFKGHWINKPIPITLSQQEIVFGF
jgi:zinc-binding in reverse transcriptase